MSLVQRQELWLPRLVLGAAIVAAVVSGVRAAAWIGATVPGFCLSRNALVERVGDPAWPALRDRTLSEADQILAVRSGSASVAVRDPADVYRFVAPYAAGSPMVYTIARDGQVIEVRVPAARFSLMSFVTLYGCSVLPPLLAFLLAWWTMRRQPQHPASAPFLLLTVVAYAGSFAFCEAMMYQRLYDLYLAWSYALAVAFGGFALVFPRPRAIVVRHPRLLGRWYLLGGAAVCAIIALRMVGYVKASTLEIVGNAFLAWSVLLLGTGVMQSYWAWHEREARERARVVLFGFAVAIPLLGASMLPGLLAGATIPPNLFFPVTLVMTGSLAYAILRGNLFELRHVLRRRSVTVALAMFWGTALFTLAVLIESLGPNRATARAAMAALVVATGFGFAATRAIVERWMDRVFFRTRAAYKPTVQQLSASLTRMLRADDVLQQTQAIVSQTLPTLRVQVCSISAIPTQLQQALANANGPICRADESTAAAALEICEADVAAPIAFEGRLRAALLLGPKRSGELYTSEDLDLLDTIANQAAIALENAYSFEELDGLRRHLEREVDVRTRELRDTQTQLVHAEKMASLGQLVAGVAHELNNPLGAVDGNLTVLHEYLVRLRAALTAYEGAAPEQQARFAAIRRELDLDAVLADLPHLLATCTEGSQRARRIVQDLRTFSRLDEAELKRIDLNEALKVTMDLLHHRVRGGVRIEAALAPLPPVECFASQLNQVFLNLLTNAFDAVESVGGGTVRASSRVLPGEWVEIAVHDSGAGVALDLRDRIFDPFFTTKPVGKGTGLGLSISYSIVAKHDGRLTLDSLPPPGATFRIALPVHPPARPARAVGLSTVSML